MAIVKFISEKKSQLFIDMEFVGIVEVNKMLKVTMEAGCYLVEAKDINGNNRRTYKLKIKPSDTQILQDLTQSNDNNKEILETLKNDSSLRFHCQRAVFNWNGLYGYINSKYKIAIPPIYSYADNFKSNKAFVRRRFPDGEKSTIIDTKGNICLEKWYDFIGQNDEKILLKCDNVFFVYNREDYSLIKEYKDAGYNNKSNLIPVYQEMEIDVFYGYIDKTGVEVIPLIYDYVWNFEENGYAQVKRFGNIHVVSSDGTLYYDIDNALKDGKCFSRKRDSLGESGHEDVFEVYHATKLSKAESMIKGFDFGKQYYPVKEGNSWGLGSYDLLADESSLGDDGQYGVYNYVPSNKIELYSCERIIYYDGDYLVYRREGICTLKKGNKEYSYCAEEIIPLIQHKHTYMGYNDVEKLCNVIIKKNKKYGIAELNGNIIVPIEYDFINATSAIEKDLSGHIGIVCKNNKCSLLNMKQGFIYAPYFKYDEIIVNDQYSKYMQMYSTFLVKKNGKYGCMDFDSHLICSIVYDRIVFTYESDTNCDYFKMLLYKKDKIGTYELYKPRGEYVNNIEIAFAIKPAYEECVFLKNNKSVNSVYGMSYVAVRKGKKWGILDNTPAWATYYPIDESYWENIPNIEDLEFKYHSLEELKENADEEFQRRYRKYYRPHWIHDYGSFREIELIDNDSN